MVKQNVLKVYRTSVAPMIDVTDTCFIRLLRLISPFDNHQLWTEMVHANAFSRGQLHRNPTKLAQSIPIHDMTPGTVVQIGASHPDDAYEAVKVLKEMGVCRVNLNCGCPSRNVQMGLFGAVLMKIPQHTADIVKAMAMAGQGDMEISVKCRIGVDDDESPEFLRQFIDTIAAATSSQVKFILHARRAWLNGLSPEQNRTIPTLNYRRVHGMIQEYPNLSFVVNGGIDTVDVVQHHLQTADGVMMGRKIREDPWFLSQLDQHIYNVPIDHIPSYSDVLDQYVRFADQMHQDYGMRYSVLGRPLYAFFNGRKGKTFRRHLGQAIPQAKINSGSSSNPVRYSVAFSELVHDIMNRAQAENNKTQAADSLTQKQNKEATG